MKFFDLHCDTIFEALKNNCSFYSNKLHISLERGKKNLPWVQCFAIFVHDDLKNWQAINYFESARKKFLDELELNANHIHWCKTAQDLQTAVQDKKCGAILTAEGGSALAGRIERLDYLKECGVKMLTLTWNGSCEIGDGCWVKNAGGLTTFGKEVVRKMPQKGINIDISHASPKLFFEVAQITQAPLVASHSNSKKIYSHPRNLSDEQFLIIKERGGLVGLNFFTGVITQKEKVTTEDLIAHAEHFLSLGGQDVLCMGSDFDGGPMPQDLDEIGKVENLYEAFLKRNYKEDLLEKIFFTNAYNFFANVL